MTWRILEGDCRDVLASLPAGSVHTVVTSPPYFGLRDYGNDGQIGLEPTPNEFVQALVGVFREVRRVLRDDGSVWLNLGDSYAGSGKGAWATTDVQKEVYVPIPGGAEASMPKVWPGVKPKDLLGIPWMVAFALRADGWYLRSEIIWAKPNAMPESVTDRPTKAHEQLFLLSKRPTYFYDADAVREPLHPDSLASNGIDVATGRGYAQNLTVTPRDRNAGEGVGWGNQAPGATRSMNPAGRNKRSVWTVATQGYAGAHFATFPLKLIEPCILAGCPERCCSVCGAPWVRVVEREQTTSDGRPRPSPPDEFAHRSADARNPQVRLAGELAYNVTTLGFEPSCTHNADPAPGTVLDPFAGAGTTGMAALRHGRSFVGIELNAEYAQLARNRIVDDCPLWNAGIEVVV